MNNRTKLQLVYIIFAAIFLKFREIDVFADKVTRQSECADVNIFPFNNLPSDRAHAVLF